MIKHHFMIKALRKLGMEGMYLNNVKPRANIILNGENPPKIWNDTRVPSIPIPIQHSTGISSQSK
jgi:hypothetical protein